MKIPVRLVNKQRRGVNVLPFRQAGNRGCTAVDDHSAFISDPIVIAGKGGAAVVVDDRVKENTDRSPATVGAEVVHNRGVRDRAEAGSATRVAGRIPGDQTIVERAKVVAAA